MSLLKDPQRLSLILGGLGMMSAKTGTQQQQWQNLMFQNLLQNARESRKQKKADDARKQLKTLIGTQAGQEVPFEQDLFPGEAPIPGLQSISPGTGFLGGQMKYPELAAQVAGIPGYESAGLNMLSKYQSDAMDLEAEARKRQETAQKLGLNVNYAVKDNKVIAYQTSQDGSINVLDVDPLLPINYQDIGGDIYGLPGKGSYNQNLLDSLNQPTAPTGQPNAPIGGSIPKTLPPKDELSYQKKLSEQQAAQKREEERRKAAKEFPIQEQNYNDLMGVIGKIEGHEALSFAAGWTNPLYDIAKNIPGTESASLEPLLKQLEGKAFMEAFEGLKGGGQITEVEGKKATEARQRIITSINAGDLEGAAEAIKEFKQSATALLELQKRRAGIGEIKRRKWGEQ